MDKNISSQIEKDFYAIHTLYKKLSGINFIDIGIVKHMELSGNGCIVTLDSGNTYKLNDKIRDYYVTNSPDNNLGENTGVAIASYQSGEAEWFYARVKIKSNPQFIVGEDSLALNKVEKYPYNKEKYEEQLRQKRKLVDAINLDCSPVPSPYILHFNSPLFERNYQILKELMGDKADEPTFSAGVKIDMAYTYFKSFGFVIIAVQPTVYEGQHRK